MILRAIGTALAIVLMSSCVGSGRSEPRVLPGPIPTLVPDRSKCDFRNETATPDRPVSVTIVQLCQDDVYGDYGIRLTRFVEPSDRSPLELALREHFKCCPNRQDNMLGVTVENGVAIVLFPPEYKASSEWANTSTAGGNRAFFPPLIETALQFSGVRQVAMRFGDAFWWPIENSEFQPVGREQGVPLEPRPPDENGPVAAVGHVAGQLRAEFSDRPWYPRVKAVEWRSFGVNLRTNLGPGQLGLASEIAVAVDRILDADSKRWCRIFLSVSDEQQKAYRIDPYAPRC